MTTSYSFRLLTHQVEISGPDREIGLVRDFLGNSAGQDAPCRYHLGYAIRPAGLRYELLEDGDSAGHASGSGELLGLLGRRLRLRIFDYLSKAGWLLIEGAIVTIAGRRLLLAGEPGPGARAVAAARLVAAGDLLEGADAVAIRAGSAIAVPFPVVVGAAALAGITDLGPALSRLPCAYESGHAGARCATVLDPSRVQPGLRLRLGPVAGICALRDGRLTHLPAHEAIATVRQAQRRPFVLADAEVARQVLLLAPGGGRLPVVAGLTAAAR